MSDTLTKICVDKKDHVAKQKRLKSVTDLEDLAKTVSPPRGFIESLKTSVRNGRYGLIAEIKKASPSKGLIRADFNPVELAKAYVRGGASCLSVLTDMPYFQGDDAYLTAARDAVDLPVLRKDFMIDPYQIVEGRSLGADCILLIMAALDDGLAGDLENAARHYAMDVLIEVHNEQELERALKLKSPLIGINNRNLKTLEVDISMTEQLASRVPDDRVLVSESGLANSVDLARMSRVGANCFLIGESLMRSDDVEKATFNLLNSKDNA